MDELSHWLGEGVKMGLFEYLLKDEDAEALLRKIINEVKEANKNI